MDRRIKYLGAIGVLSLMSILLATGFVDELSAEKSEGRIANPYGSATKGIVCGDRLCSETGGRILMPWETLSNEIEQQNCFSAGVQVPCEEINDTLIEEEITNDTNTEMDEMKNSIETNVTGFVSVNHTKANVPVTIPLHLGYYIGDPIYYIITDSSDQTHADTITNNQGWKVNLAPLLANATEDSLSKTYMFTNGVPGDGVNGFQGELFTSTPAQADVYSALTSNVNVTWKAGTIPIILDSEKEMLIAEKRGWIYLNEIDIVLNMPQIVWADGQMPVKEDSTLKDKTPFVGGQVLDIDLENMTTTFIARSAWDSEGKTIYFIVTDATPVGPALSLGVPNVPKNAALISNPAAADVYHFLNGIEGSGPLGFQAGIVSASPGDAGYSPMSRIFFITWNDPDDATLLQTRSDIDQFEKDELISISLATPMAADHIVNTPIIEPILNKSSILE